MKNAMGATYGFDEGHRWTIALDSILGRLEGAEMGLANEGPGRRDSGSYYTPADVAAHFWRLFWRHHQVVDGPAAVRLVQEANFVEPSVGSGMFLFSLLRSLSDFGVGPADASSIRFRAVDINRAALDFVEKELRGLEREFSVRFNAVTLEEADFLKWVAGGVAPSTTFVGNPPFVANERGSQWKNMYADFVASMLAADASSNISLILPVSVCFSRDYVALRRLLRDTKRPLSASSYDNIPDCLFKAGKPESGNTNKANSQRCTILQLGGPRVGVVESSSLLRWSAGARSTFLSAMPAFHDCADFDLVRQIPRPTDASLTEYLREAEGGRSAREFMSRIGRGAFAVGAVARNFIGIRDYQGVTPGVIPVRTNERESSLILLQVLASDVFYKYWRSFGDGFHVTIDLIDRFPISKNLLSVCEQNLDTAEDIWSSRERYAKTKLNSGKTIKSYDFSQAFSGIVA